MPKTIPPSSELAYLRTLALTGNATEAARAARVSRDWAYKKRKQDAGFERLCGQAAAIAKARLPARVNRDRADGWTAERKAHFLAALAVTRDVELAASSAGSTAPSAYRRRLRRPGFAVGWHQAMESGEAPHALEWFQSAECFFEGRAVPEDNPVKVTSIDEVLRMLGRVERAERRRNRG